MNTPNTSDLDPETQQLQTPSTVERDARVSEQIIETKEAVTLRLVAHGIPAYVDSVYG